MSLLYIFQVRPKTQWIFIALDHVICLCVTAPFVPSFWRGTWFLFGHYVFPSNPEHHGWTLASVGMLGAVFCYLLQNKMVEWFKRPGPITWFIVYHVFFVPICCFQCCPVERCLVAMGSLHWVYNNQCLLLHLPSNRCHGDTQVL